MRKTIFCVAIAGVMLLGGCGKIGTKEPTTIDLNEYIDYEIEGYSTKATLSYTIRYDDIIDDFELEDVAAGRLEKKITGTWSKMTYLANGDEITFEWNVDADSIEEKYNVEFEAKDLTVEVKDLDEMPEYDPFEYIEVSFSGMDGDGDAAIDQLDTNPLDGVCYRFDDSSYWLSNGDEITVTAYCNSGDLADYCEDNDYILTQSSMTYTVEGLDSYVASIDELTPEMLAELQTQAQDTITASFDLEDGESVTSVNYIGLYLFVTKDYDYSWNHNMVYLIYEVRIATPAGEILLYTYVGYDNIILLADGTNEIYDILDTDMPYSWDGEVGIGEYSWGSYEYEHTGFATVTDMYNSVFRPELEDYTITNNIPDEYLNAAPVNTDETEAEVPEETEETGEEG